MKHCEHCSAEFHLPTRQHGEAQRFCSRTCANKAWRAINRVEVATYNKAYWAANADKMRANAMIKHPENYRKAYDPEYRPRPARYDPALGGWVLAEVTILPAPDTSPAAHLAAALIIIEERLAEA